MRERIRSIVSLSVALCACSAPPREAIVVGDAGFKTPESVLHDPVADVYLVSNINGAPLDRDDNGFVSRLSPTGDVVALTWIDGARPEVTLHAPKGMAIRGDTLFVSDIDSVRLFDRRSGDPVGAWGVPGATFLNDLAVGPDGTLYLTDSGWRAGADGFENTATDALWRFDLAGVPSPVVQTPDLGNPNGILAEAAGITVVSMGSGQVSVVDDMGARTQVATPGGGLDGVVRAGDALLVSRWADSAIYRVTGAGEVSRIITGIESPADIGYDAGRRRVLVPVFLGNRVEIRPVP